MSTAGATYGASGTLQQREWAVDPPSLLTLVWCPGAFLALDILKEELFET